MAGTMKPKSSCVFSSLPKKLVENLMPFQRDGVEFAIRKNGRCLIADEMGLGKTLQAISVAYYYKEEWPLLIIVPSSLRYSWIEEFEKWLPDVSPGDINLVQSGNDISDISKAKVTITTFGLLSKGTSRILREALQNQGFHVVIVDESHYIRNTKTMSAKTVVPLIKNAQRRILLSGTPALARPVELYPQIDAICPNMFGTWWTYTARYCDAKVEWIGKVKKRNVIGASNLEELQQKMSELLMIRREKSQVLTQLPAKQRQRVLFDLKDSNLKQEIRQTFDELKPLLKKASGKQDTFEVLTGAGEHDTKDLNTLSLIQRLYRLSGEAKIGPAKEYVEMLCENPKLKFLVFAYHHNMMNGLSESLHDKDVKFIRIDGETPPSERPHLVHQFQSDPDTRVAILSILAAGVGLTLTAATVVVFAEMYWTPGTLIQCEDRAHRIGQTSCVAVHYLVAKDTMDEWVWSAVCKKTIVTSTTLTGKKRKMEALEGDSYQVDVLSNADVWVPTSDADTDASVTQYLMTHQDSDQRSILDFFSPGHVASRRVLKDEGKCLAALANEVQQGYPPSHGKVSHNEAVVNNSMHEQAYSSPACKRQRVDDGLVTIEKLPGTLSGNSSTPVESLIVIESDVEEDFVLEKVSAKKKKKESASSRKRKRDSSNKLSPLSDTKCHLTTLFKNKSTKEAGVFNESSDTEKENSNSECTPSQKVSNGGKKDSVNCEQEKWSCEQCTFLNHKALTYCEICEYPKKEKMALQKLRNKMGSSASLNTKAKRTGSSPCTGLPSTRTSTGVREKDLSQTNKFKNNVIDIENNMSVKGTQESSKKTVEGVMESDGDTGDELYSEGNSQSPAEDDTACYVDDVMDFDPYCNLDVDETASTDNSGNAWNDSDNPDLKNKKNSDLCKHEYDSHKTKSRNNGASSVLNCSDGKTFQHNECDKISNVNEHSQDTFKTNISDDVNEMDCSLKTETETVVSDSAIYSRYFSPDQQSNEIPANVKKKQIVLKNTLECVASSQNAHISDSAIKDNGCRKADMLCARGSSIAQESPTERKPVTPKSAKSWRFKSVSKHRQNSPTASSPREILKAVGAGLSNESTKLKEEANKRVNGIGNVKHLSMNASEPSSELWDGEVKTIDRKETGVDELDKGQCDAVDSRTVLMEGQDQLSAGVQQDHQMTPEPDTAMLDQSFSSPEIDNILATETDHVVEEAVSRRPEKHRVIDLDSIQRYPMFKYLCSKYTDRIYLLTQDKEPLNLNFIPADVQFGNDDGLPNILLHPDNLRLVQRFVREWLSLTETKRRLIVKSGEPFISPVVQYENLRSCKSVNTQRHKTKADVSIAAHLKARDVNGSVRQLSKHAGVHDEDEKDTGIAQALSGDGTPLCVQCHQPYTNPLIARSTVRDENNAWSTRFCSRKCSQDFWMVSNTEYIRDRVFEAEHGICQMCNIDAHGIFKQVKETFDHRKRAEIISKSQYSCLTIKVKEQMVKKPSAGQYWHVDHIVPVWEGGGQCDIDNLRTLCIVCHQKVTAKQAAKRATVRKLGAAVNSGDISVFFQKS